MKPATRNFFRPSFARLPALALSAAIGFASSTAAFALSEIQKEELPPPAGTEQQPTAAPSTGETPAQQAPAGTPETTAPGQQAPAGTQEAPAAEPTPSDEPAGPTDDQPSMQNEEDPDQDVQDRPDVDPNAPLPEVSYDLTKLPEPVQRMHKLLIEAAKTGDPEKLRPLLGMGEGATQLSLADLTEDPIKFLKGQSGDEDGQEILAILEEVLEAGYVHLDAGTPQELYVWPYFFAYPLDRLTPQQKVEIYRIVTASDFDEMQNFGNYIFYRIGISPEGRWAFFVAGE